MSASCPNCGNTETLEDLEGRIRVLKERKRRQDSVDVISPGPRPNPVFAIPIPTFASCSNCGTMWQADARTLADQFRAQIKQLEAEVMDAVERLGILAEQPALGEGRGR